MASEADSSLRSPWLAIGLVSLGVFFTALDQTVVVTVLPKIMLDLKVAPTELDQAAWIITGYLLGYTVAIPLMARLADVYGYKRLLMTSLVVFAVGSVLVALSPNLPWLVTFRVVQALGGGATVPIGLALVTRALPSQRRALAVGIIGASAEAGVVLGPLYGGGITAALDWRWLFWLNLPQVAILLLTFRYLPTGKGSGGRVDYTGGLLLALGLTLLLIALSRREAFAISSPTPYLLGLLGLLVMGSLVWVEGRARQPLLSGLFFRSRSALSALSTKLMVGAALIIAMVTVPLMANTVLGQSPLEGGLRLMRLTGALPVGAVLGGYLAYRRGAGAVILAGLALAAAGLLFMSRWEVDIGEPELSIHLAITGLGFGLVIAPIFVTVMDVGGPAYQATSASLVTVARMTGMALGMAALSAWGMEHFLGLTEGLLLPIGGEDEEVLEYNSRLTQASITLFQDFFRAGAIVALVAAIPALMGLARTRPRPITYDHAQEGE